jgi:ATP-dependent Clp protease ATP-binding subunit ClpA
VGFAGNPSPNYLDEVREFFRPEFFNRIDGVVTFQPLGEATIREITRKELKELSRREGLRRLNLHLDPAEELVDLLAREGFDIRYGARPLQRTIERTVVAPLARWLLEHPHVHSISLRLGLNSGGELTIDS